MRSNGFLRIWVLTALLAPPALGAGPMPVPGDDLTFRPTVIVRGGDGQGSGTVIASVPGEALVLTAAHVVRGTGPVRVELHRYNLGLERTRPADGWPRTLAGEVAAADPAGDVAVVRLRGCPTLPYVARLTAAGDEPGRGAAVTSLGVDGGARLDSWATRVREVSWFSMGPKPADDPGTGDRPFLITDRAPEQGRSGGGLFLDGGRLAGVCVGRVEVSKGRARGVFASTESVRLLLRDHDLEEVVARSARVVRPGAVQRTRKDQPSSK